jgi:hypothetical protein
MLLLFDEASAVSDDKTTSTLQKSPMGIVRRFFCLDVADGEVSRLSRAARVAHVLTAPWALIPWGVVFFWFASWLDCLVRFAFPPTEVSRRPEALLFLQGGTDWGGAEEFVLSAIALPLFGLLAAIHLSLRMRTLPTAMSFRQRLDISWRIISTYWGFFVMAALIVLLPPYQTPACSCEYDVRVLFITATVVFLATHFLIVWLAGTSLPNWLKTLLAPSFLALWLVMGSDGQTPRAGQMLAADEEPLPATRGLRHGTMLAWRRLCLLTIGRRERRADPETASLWYWTDGSREFGKERATSRSARALRRESLPWLDGPAFVVPVATDDTRPCRFPYYTRPDFRQFCGYMLKTEGRLLPLYFGRMDVPRFRSRDICLKEGQPYWTFSLTTDGATARLMPFSPVCWWEDPVDEPDIGAPAILHPQTEPVPTQLCFSRDVPYASLTNWILRLNENGYRPLHIWLRGFRHRE